MSVSSIHGTHCPLDAAIQEVLRFRETYRAFDMTVPVKTVSFDVDNFGKPYMQVGVVGDHTRLPIAMSIAGSGTRSMCNVLGIQYKILSRLSAQTAKAVFEDLMEFKFKDSKRFITLRGCMVDGAPSLRAVSTNRSKIYDDKDVFPVIMNSVDPDLFEAKEYWSDDYISAIRVLRREPIVVNNADVRIGFDVINSEVREHSIEVVGVVSFPSFDIAVPKRIYGLKRNSGKSIPIALLTAELSAVVERLMEVTHLAFVEKWQGAASEVRQVGRLIRDQLGKGVFCEEDARGILSDLFPGKMGGDVDVERAVNDVFNSSVNTFDFVESVSTRAAKLTDYDSFFKRSRMEMLANMF